MLSTLLNYRLYASDLPKTLARVEARSSVEREVRYYQENIAKVRSVDDLLGDYRLTAYVLKAHGLSEQISSPAFVRKILQSDLSDPQSFANRLSDPRYRALAATFDFQVAEARPGIQSQAQTDRLVEAYSEHLVRGGAIAAQRAGAFETRMKTVASVDEFLADPQMFEMAAKIADLDPALLSRSYMRSVLLGDVPEGQTLPDGLAFLSTAFSFAPDGSAANDAQTPARTASFVRRYFAAVGQAASSQAAAFEGRHFEAVVANVSTVEDLLRDPVLAHVLRVAAGLPEAESSDAALVNLLSLPEDHPNNPIARTSGTDSASLAHREALVAVKSIFDFVDGRGTAPVTDDTRVAALLTRFYDGVPKVDDTQIALKTNSFRVQLSGMSSIGDLLGRHPVYGKGAFEFVLKAFDIDPTNESASKIRRVLTSDPSDPNSYVRRLKDERYEKLAAAFNFGADGKVAPERLAQSVRAQQKTGSLYAASFGPDPTEARKAAIRKDTLAYLGAVGGVTSLDALLADRETLAYALRAHGLQDENLSTRDLRALLTSDLSDPKSFARLSGDKRFADFAGSFNFTPDGRIARAGVSAQDGGSLLSTQNLYLLQMLEEEAGATSEGTRLALYFLRKSPDIKNAFSILADKALLEVARTVLGLPQQMSQLDVDRQAAILKSRIDFETFKDAKKLDAFIARFATLHDMNNGGGASDPILQLFGGSAGRGGLVGLF